jgi:hypothetical protein
MSKVPVDLTNKRFGRLTAIRPTSKRISGNRAWECICSCGNLALVPTTSLNSGKTRSCGCLRKENNIKHGHCVDSQSTEYRSWVSMRKRCQNPTDVGYNEYGSRGITVCARWASFAAFLDDMGPKPSPLHSIDRIDNEGPYSPENCRWATSQQQARNRRSNRLVKFKGKMMCLAEAIEASGQSFQLVKTRLYRGWTIDRALTQKVGATRKANSNG